MLKVLTPIYPPHIKPVRDGLYLTCRVEDSGAMSIQTVRHWNGTVWCHEWGPICVDQTWSWRGLAFDPAAAFDHDSWNWKEPGDIESGGYEKGVFLPGATCE